MNSSSQELRVGQQETHVIFPSLDPSLASLIWPGSGPAKPHCAIFMVYTVTLTPVVTIKRVDRNSWITFSEGVHHQDEKRVQLSTQRSFDHAYKDKLSVVFFSSLIDCQGMSIVPPLQRPFPMSTTSCILEVVSDTADSGRRWMFVFLAELVKYHLGKTVHKERGEELLSSSGSSKTALCLGMDYFISMLYGSIVKQIDEQIVPRSQWLTIRKSNLLFNAQKIQKNPIFQISVDTLSNTNFFQAFTASANVPAIYLQQFWNTMKYNEKTGVYSCQVDEQWFDLSADLLRKALAITPVIPAHPFELPPSGNIVIDFVNELGYPEPVEIISNIRVNYVYQPWRAILSLINQCLTGKTSSSDKPRHPVLQMLWGIVTQTNVDHAELIWEEFTQGIQTFFSHKASHKASLKNPKKKENPTHVYRLKKALYGLKQAPRAWYDTLSKFLLANHFFKGVVDPTLFTRKSGKHILLVQIYVDDIIFASTDHNACNIFSKEMSSKFQMSMMGQMSFFLGLQVSQSPGGIFINQAKYALETLKKYGMDLSDPVDTPMVDRLKLDEDLMGIPVDQTRFRGIWLPYLALQAVDPLLFAVCMCARYQAKPTKKHFEAIKRVFRYLKGTINMGLWYLKDNAMSLTAYADAVNGMSNSKEYVWEVLSFFGDRDWLVWSIKEAKEHAISTI
ncbi:retrovirus-related pol polyprotein from transposon TNT 1-94 [Tanacetum coccineum]